MHRINIRTFYFYIQAKDIKLFVTFSKIYRQEFDRADIIVHRSGCFQGNHILEGMFYFLFFLISRNPLHFIYDFIGFDYCLVKVGVFFLDFGEQEIQDRGF